MAEAIRKAFSPDEHELVSELFDYYDQTGEGVIDFLKRDARYLNAFYRAALVAQKDWLASRPSKLQDYHKTIEERWERLLRILREDPRYEAETLGRTP